MGKWEDKSFFLPADEGVVPALSEVSTWASQQTYEAAAIAGFLQVADYYLIAHAKAHEWIIVTHEVPSESVRKIKIPNACIGLGITCVTPYEMLRVSMQNLFWVNKNLIFRVETHASL